MINIIGCFHPIFSVYMKYLNVEKFDETGLVKTLMVLKDQARWRIYSHDIKADMEDLKYYDELSKHFGISPSDMIRIPQKHSSNIFIAKRKDAGMGVVRMETEGDFDGILTDEKNLMLLTIESDCTPIYILDPIKKVIGMVHSGWRGAASKIGIKAIEMMVKNYGSDISDILIYFGPSICGNCYEVGEELVYEFEKILTNDELDKVFTKKGDKLYLDVTAAIKFSILKIGVKEENIDKSKYCTYHDNLFASWRRDKDKSQQMLTGIMLI